MKIIYLTYTTELHNGATQSFLIMLKELIKKGIEPHVILTEYGDGSICRELDKMNIEYSIVRSYFCKYPPLKKKDFWSDLIKYAPRLIKDIGFNKLAYFKIKKIVKKIKPNIIHTNIGPMQVGADVARKLNIPHVWHIREYQTFGLKPYPSLDKLKKKLNNHKNHCIAVSKGVFGDLSLDKIKDRVIYDGVTSEKNIRFTENKENYFLYVSRLQKSKGIELLLNAYIKLGKAVSKEKLPKLMIAGDTDDKSYKNKLLNIVKTNKLEGKVQFLGNRDDVFDLMYRAKALIVPSFSEGFGRITVEAIFNGCAVIGYNNTGTKEILERNNSGLLYTSEQELINILKDISENGIESHYEMIKRAQETSVSLYTTEVNTNAVLELYNENK